MPPLWLTRIAQFLARLVAVLLWPIVRGVL